MYSLAIAFEIPNAKLHEFNLATGHLINWPIFSRHNIKDSDIKKEFLVLKKWSSKTEMDADTQSHKYENLMGAIKVLGHITNSELHMVEEDHITQMKIN